MSQPRCKLCGAVLADNTRWCPQCGARHVNKDDAPPFTPPAGMQLTPSPIRICPGCGVIAPTTLARCKWCNTDFPTPPLTAPGAVGSALWAYISESDFACRACGLRSPVPLCFEGEAECLRCGLRQLFEPDEWQSQLDFAHDVVDVCGPDPAGRFPQLGLPGRETDYRSIGVEHALVQWQQAVPGLRALVGPGHPLCTKCKALLSVEVQPDGVAEASCIGCGDRATYALPARATQFFPEIRAVIGDEHRTDRPGVRLGPPDAAGVSALLCPSCGSPLTVAPDADLATCAYCSTTSRIGRRGWSRASGEAPPFEPFWVLLDGPGPMRRGRLARAKEAPRAVQRKKAPRPTAEPDGTPSPPDNPYRNVIGCIAFTIFAAALSGLAGWFFLR